VPILVYVRNCVIVEIYYLILAVAGADVDGADVEGANYVDLPRN
jgi:hypothetical protein